MGGWVGGWVGVHKRSLLICVAVGSFLDTILLGNFVFLYANVTFIDALYVSCSSLNFVPSLCRSIWLKLDVLDYIVADNKL